MREPCRQTARETTRALGLGFWLVSGAMKLEDKQRLPNVGGAAPPTKRARDRRAGRVRVCRQSGHLDHQTTLALSLSLLPRASQLQPLLSQIASSDRAHFDCFPDDTRMSTSWQKRKTRLSSLIGSTEGGEDAEALVLDQLMHGQTVIGKTGALYIIESSHYLLTIEQQRPSRSTPYVSLTRTWILLVHLNMGSLAW